MSVSIRDLHRLTATAIERHRELHRSHHHVAHQAAAQRQATRAAVPPTTQHPLSGTPAPVEGPAPVGSSRG